jgi:AraC-like DNA-binding protein
MNPSNTTCLGSVCSAQPSLRHSSSLSRPVADSQDGRVRAQVWADSHDKIRRAIGKERRVSPSHRYLNNPRTMRTIYLPQLETDSSREGNGVWPVEIWKARNFIHEHLDEELSLTQVAKAANISPNYLSEKFRQVTGVNFVSYIARRRFEKARDFLHDPNLRVSEIAFAVGFQSLSQFNRVFKKLSGQSPTEYRVARAKRRC